MSNGIRLVHPGEILREDFVLPLGLSGNALAQSLRVPANRINAILSESRGLSADTALRLARFFGTTAEFWMNLQKTYELRVAELQVGPSIKREVPRSRLRLAPQLRAASAR
jgi:antitoxin HigA-1